MKKLVAILFILILVIAPVSAFAIRTGELDGAIMGGEYQKVYDSGELTTAVTSINVSGLDGNTDGEYEIIARIVNNAASDPNYFIRLNNDSGANYGEQLLYGRDTVAGAYTPVNASGLRLNYPDGAATNEILFSRIILHATSGCVRTALIKTGMRMATTMPAGSVNIKGAIWNNTSDNINSLIFFSDVANGFGIGTRIIILRRNTAGVGIRAGTLDVQGKLKGCFQKVYETTLTTAATSITISGLDGNTDILYKLVCKFVNDGGAGSTYGLRPNNDTGSNYGYQYLVGRASVANCNRGVLALFELAALESTGVGNVNLVKGILYAKSGYVRTFIRETVENVSGTTVNATSIEAESWNNTADNITSLVFVSDQANGFGVGTYICLEAYQPQ